MPFCFYTQVIDGADSDNELRLSEADDDVNGDVSGDETDSEFIFTDDDSPEGDGETGTSRAGKTRRQRREKPPQPVIDVLITTPSDVADDVSLKLLPLLKRICNLLVYLFVCLPVCLSV